MNGGETRRPQIRRVVFGGLAGFILLAPALPQVLDVHSPIFRPWVMYSAVGLGLLRGDIVVTRAGGAEMLTPEAFLGLKYYPRTMTLKDRHVVLDEAALSARMAAFCEANVDVDRLSFDGRMAWLDGWRPLKASVDCAQ